jgi:hypothetical protein
MSDVKEPSAVNLAFWDDIPDAMVQQDIDDTLREIQQRKVAMGLNIPNWPVSRLTEEIAAREEFIRKLRLIQALRLQRANAGLS